MTVAPPPRVRLGYIIADARRSRKMLCLAPLRLAWLLATILLPASSARFRAMTRNLAELIRRLRYHQTIENTKWPEEGPLISVVIPCYNYGQFVDGAIDSVLDQTFQDFEIIVVDGGSSDPATIERLKSLSKPKTTVYFREGRHLVGDNRNFGIERARGKYICCLDADDRLLSTYLEKALFFAETYNYDVVYPFVQCFGGADTVWGVRDVDFLTCAEINGISTVAIFKREAWRKVGGYKDSGLGSEHVPEDWEFWVRVLGDGHRAKSIPEPLMLYRVHGLGLTASAQMPMEKQRAIIREENAGLFLKGNLRRVKRMQKTEFTVLQQHLNLMRRRVPRRKRALFALPFTVVGGADTILLEIAKYLARNDFDITVVTTLAPHESMGDNSEAFRKISPEVYHLYSFLESAEQWRDFLFYLIATRQVDVIFLVGSGFVYGLLPQIKREFPHVKVVDQLFNAVGHIRNNRLYSRFIDLNIVATEEIARVLIERHGERPEKVTVILHGVDTVDRLDPRKIAEAGDGRGSPALRGKFVISFIGRFSPEKCPEKFVRIAGRLQHIKDALFLMIGDGPIYPNVKRAIEASGCAPRFYAPGFVDDVRPFLKATSVLVIPSMIEGIPIVLMEGLSLGVPVVASRVGGIPSIVKDGYNGFLCDPDDLEAFAGAIALLRADSALRGAMSRNAREYAVKNLGLEQMSRRYLESFLDVISMGGARRD